MSDIVNIINVRAYGATGNGMTDDTAAMRAAHNTGRIVYYPAGTYKFSSTVTIASGGIIGEGNAPVSAGCAGATVLYSTDTTEIINDGAIVKVVSF